MEYQAILSMVGDTLDRLHKSNVIKDKIICTEDTVLIGKGAELDSLAFVTFISDMEEQVSNETGNEIFFDLDKIADFNAANPFISVHDFSNYVASLSSSLDTK